jgi:lipopolysaccharide biosynthesis glycosyltransferase
MRQSTTFSMVACPGGAAASAVVTLSIGSRPFVGITLPFMKAYAERIGAAFHVVNQREHEALQHQTAGTAYSSSTSSAASRFLKLPLLEYFLKRYERILFLDDDILVSANMPDLFAAVPCDAIGATVERHKPVGWHATQWTSACDLYGMNHACEPKRWQIWNSGVMLLSRAVHAPLLAAGWKRDAHRLSCRVLCDQLYLNALFKRAGARVCDLGAAFNFVGSELRRALVVGGGFESQARRSLGCMHAASDAQGAQAVHG